MEVYGKGTEKDAGMTYKPNEDPFNADYNVEGKVYYVYDGSKSYKGFMIEAVIMPASDQMIIRWFYSTE